MPLDRPDVYVVARFLEKLRGAPGPVGKTGLQMSVRLNYSVFKRYLAWLSERGMVALVPFEEGAERVVLTKKGYDTLARLEGLLRDFTQADPPE